MKRLLSLIKKLLSSRVFQGTALVLGILVMLFVAADFAIMPMYTRQGTEQKVPDLTRMTVEEAQTVAEEHGFCLLVEPAKFGGRVEPGQIIEQRPLAESLSKPGRKIRVVPSKGVGSNVVPDLVGREVRDAQIRCRNIGLICGPTEISYQFSRMTPQGLVLEQVPVEGEEVQPGTTMRLVVSLGPEPHTVRVPALVEKSLHDARQTIIEAGLELGRVARKETNVYTAGTVIAQSIRTGTEVEPATRVDLVVAIPVPSRESPAEDL